jgi:hypothetical protein
LRLAAKKSDTLNTMKTSLFVGLSIALFLAPAFAQSTEPAKAEEPDSSGENGPEEQETQESTAEESTPEESAAEATEDTDVDLLQSEAVRAPELTENQIDWLKPKRELMDQVPRAQVDFTAYTLEFGEVKVGLANVLVGVAPRVQLGTSPALYALGVTNFSGKANPVRFGRFDLAVDGSFYSLGLGDFRLTYTGGGGRLSAQVSDPVSIHFGGTINRIQGGGTPDISGINPILLGSTQEEMDEWADLVKETGAKVDLDATVYTVNFATDWRFNRRDSLIFQAGAWLNVNATAEVNVPPIAGLEEAFNETRDYDLGDAYMASIAYHIAGKHWEFRFGIGLSSANWAWLLQSTEFSYRNGGATRMSEWRTRKTWRKNAGDVQN